MTNKELEQKYKELLNAMADLSMRFHAFESKCREFEKQRFQPIADRVMGLCKTEEMRYGKLFAELKGVPVCKKCEGKGRTWA